MNNRMAREIAARVWAQKSYGCSHLVCDLQKGDRFRFPSGSKTLIYSGNGWYYRTDSHRKFRTGTLTAIIKIEGQS